MHGLKLTPKQERLARDMVAGAAAGLVSFLYAPLSAGRDVVQLRGNWDGKAHTRKVHGGLSDLKALEREGFISVRWGQGNIGFGEVCPRAFDAVRDNFNPPGGRVTVAPGLTSRNRHNAGGGNGTDLRARLAAAASDLLDACRGVLPPDELEGAEADVSAVDRQIHSDSPDPEVVTRRAKSLLTRLAAAMGSADELAEKGGGLGEAIRKAAPYVTTVAHWVGTCRGRH